MSLIEYNLIDSEGFLLTETGTGDQLVTTENNYAPVASFNKSASSGSAPQTINFTDTSTNSPSSWFWDFGDGTSSNQQNPSHTYNFAGNYNATLTASNLAGSNQTTSIIQIRDAPPLGETFDFKAVKRPFFHSDPTELWENVTRTKKYEDGLPTFNKLNDSPPIIWQLIYNGLSPQQAAEFDAHYTAYDTTRTFTFIDKWGNQNTNCYYNRFQKSHQENKSWIKTRTIEIIKYPGDSLNVTPSQSNYAPLIDSQTGKALIQTGAGEVVYDPATQIPAKQATDVMVSDYVEVNDPANDPAFGVLAGKSWTQVDQGGNFIARKTRNKSNTGWITTSLPNGGGVTNGDRGDIEVSNTGATWLIKLLSVTTEKLGGDISNFAKSLLKATGAAAVKTLLALELVPNKDATLRSNHTGTQGFGSISGITATRLLGRYSANFGPAEEISIGANLSLTNGVLSATATGGGSGTPGADGTIWRSGAGIPANSLGLNNDYYLNSSTGDFYKKSNGAYTLEGNLKGPQGLQGIQGPPGSGSTTTAADLYLTNLPAGSGALIAPNDSVLSAFAKAKFQLAQVGNAYTDISRFMTSGETDITNAVKSAMVLNAGGGCILIPRGNWNLNENLLPTSAMTILGTGSNLDDFWGTQINLIQNPQTGQYPNSAFKITGVQKNISFKDMIIRMRNAPNANGVLIENNTGNIVYFTHFENVTFLGGANGINVNATGGGNLFECIQNTIDRCKFIGQKAAFKCNTVNSGFTFNSPYFSLETFGSNVQQYSSASAFPSVGSAGIYYRDNSTKLIYIWTGAVYQIDRQYVSGVGLDIIGVGNLTVNGALCVGNQPSQSNVQASDRSCFLRTHGAYNNIVIKDGEQDENIEYQYRNTTNPYDASPVTWEHCLIQSKMFFTTAGAVSLKNVTYKQNNDPMIFDSVNGVDGYARIFVDNESKFIRNIAATGYGDEYVKLANFLALNNQYSRIVNADGSIGERYIQPANDYSQIVKHITEGVVNVYPGVDNVIVNNNLIAPSTIVNAYMVSQAAGGTLSIAGVESFDSYFKIRLTGNAAAGTRVGFRIVA